MVEPPTSCLKCGSSNIVVYNGDIFLQNPDYPNKKEGVKAAAAICGDCTYIMLFGK
ncbi:MAG: hypothetical protein IIA83_12370 [Thaumarchaeota archaeon]|nr:hypothetical protein [Nitrososphaerota archaeon]